MASDNSMDRLILIKQDKLVPSAEDDVFIGRLICMVRQSPHHMVLMSKLPDVFLKMNSQRIDEAFDLLGFCRDLTLIHPLRVSTIDWRDKDLYLMYEEKYFYSKWLKQMLADRRFALVEEAIGHRMPGDAVTMKNIDEISKRMPPHPIQEIKPYQQMRVVLVNVVSPGEMYGHLWKYRQAFLVQRQSMRRYNKELREEVDKNGQETDIVIPWEFLIPLLPVAVRNPLDNYQWNRCLVYEYPQLPMVRDMITCFSLDFGNTFEVDRRECRYLKTEFLTQLPVQALRMSMHGIEPIYNDKVWSKKAGELLNRKFVKKRYWIYCDVQSVGESSCRVRLCFHTSQKRIHLDHLLVLHELAVYDDDHIAIEGCDEDSEKEETEGVKEEPKDGEKPEENKKPEDEKKTPEDPGAEKVPEKMKIKCKCLK